MARIQHDSGLEAGTQTEPPYKRKGRALDARPSPIPASSALRQSPPPLPPRPLFLGSFFGGITFGGVGFGTGGAFSVYSVRCSTLTLGRVTLTSMRRRFLVGSGLLE